LGAKLHAIGIVRRGRAAFVFNWKCPLATSFSAMDFHDIGIAGEAKAMRYEGERSQHSQGSARRRLA